MLRRTSPWSTLYLLSIRSQWEVASAAHSQENSCGGVLGGLQLANTADQGSLLLQSQVRKPQDVSNGLSEEMLRELIGPHDRPVQFLSSSLRVNQSGNQALSQVEHALPVGSTSAAKLSQMRIFSGVAPDGGLAQVDSGVHSRLPVALETRNQAMSSNVDPHLKEVHVKTQQFESIKDQNSVWKRSKQLAELLEITLLHRNQSLAEGVMLFLLCNIFLCAVVSGICFIWSGRHAEGEDDADPLLPSEKAIKKREQMTGIGALEERRSHQLAKAQAPARSSAGRPNHETPRTLANGPASTPTTPARQLCPELVVPLGSECVLAVRCLITAKTQQCEFDVLDINGKAVLRVEMSPQSALSRNSHVPSQRSPTITLKALQPRETTGGLVLAYCCNVTRADDMWSSSGKRNVCIYNETDELFAHIVKDEARHRYVLTSGRPGLQLLFEGNFEERAVDVANEARELLAATEPAAMPFDPINKYYKLRVAADVDVGLVLCGLLAIDQIEIK